MRAVVEQPAKDPMTKGGFEFTLASKGYLFAALDFRPCGARPSSILALRVGLASTRRGIMTRVC